MKEKRTSVEDIENYLNGSLKGTERASFESEIESNSALAKEVSQYKVLFGGLDAYQTRKNLRGQLDEFHEEMTQTTHLKISSNTPKDNQFFLVWKKYKSNVLVAACVAILAIFTTTWVLDDSVRSIEQKQKNYFLSLRRDLNKVKQKQDRLAQDQKISKTPKPVKEYGATAFVISSNGYLVTSYHVVKDADSIYVETTRDNKPLSFKVENIYSDPSKDLAVLRIIDPEFIGFPELPYTIRSEEANLGEDVFTLAYPRQEMVYGEGSISAQSGYRGDTLTYQISIPVNPGNSGGPLLDSQGNLIGIVVGKHLAMDGAAFAVKVKHLKADLDSLALNAEIPPILIPKNSNMQFLKRPGQINLLKDFVFVVRVYNGKD